MRLFSFILLATLISSCASKPDYTERRVPQKNSRYLGEQGLTNRGQNYVADVAPRLAPQQATMKKIKPQNNKAGFFDKIFNQKEEKKNVVVTDEVASGKMYQIKQQAIQKQEVFLDEQDSAEVVDKVVVPQPMANPGLTHPAAKIAEPKVAAPVVAPTKIRRDEKIENKAQIKYVQVGAFKRKQNALDLMTSLEKYGNVSLYPLTRSSGTLYVVRIGPLLSQADAIEAQRQMKEKGFSGAFITTK